MKLRTTSLWKSGIATTALLAAIAVYCLARLHPPQLLTAFQATEPFLSEQTSLFGSAPSLLYTFAIGLFIGNCATSRTAARLHCSIWLGIALLLEISQHSMIAKPLASWLAAAEFAPIREFIGSYWIHGVFDPRDIVATIGGGLAALTLLAWLPTGDDDEIH